MSKRAALLLNLGSPDSTAVGDVRRYLREFLSDERVMATSPLKRSLILNLMILPFRPAQSAEAYSKIWLREGSPLVVTSQRQRRLLQEQVDIPVALAMRYGNPSVADTVAGLARNGLEELFVMPLYPHYAMASYETVLVRVVEEVAQRAPGVRLSILQPFYADPAYVDALVESAAPYISGEFDLLLFSFHGVPEKHLRKTDPSHSHCLFTPDCCNTPHPAHATCYRHQCFETVRKFIERSGISPEKHAVSFQSRLGRQPWLKPYTDLELERLARQGIKKILVMCPAFVTDCLETLEEIAMRGKEIFEQAGGESLTLIPCLNESPQWIRFLAGKVQGWSR